MGRTHILGFTIIMLVVSGTLAIASCGETINPIDSPPDGGSSTPETSTPPSNDGSSSNADGNGGVDGGGSGDGSAQNDAATCDCKPDFCGCGQCKREDIVCTKTPVLCPLTCPTMCDTTNVKCGCAGDRCVSVTPAPDKIPCYTTLDCPTTKCCKKDALERSGVCIDGPNGC